MAFQQESLEQMISALRAGGSPVAAGIEAGQQGFRQGQNDVLEQRKAAFAQKLQMAGILKGSDLGDAGREVGIEPTREITPEAAQAIAKFKEVPVKEAMPLMTKEAIDAEVADINQQRRMMGMPPTSGKAIYEAKTAMQQKDLINSLNRRSGIGAGLFNAGQAPLRSAQSDVLKSFDALAEMRQSLDDLNKTYTPEMVGPLQGRVGQIQQTTGVGATKERGEFLQATARLQNAVMKARSGGAVTPAEAERLMNELPNQKTSPVDYETRLNKATELFNKVLAQKVQLSRGALDPNLLAPVVRQAPEAQPQAAGSIPSAADIDAEMRRRGLK